MFQIQGRVRGQFQCELKRKSSEVGVTVEQFSNEYVTSARNVRHRAFDLKQPSGHGAVLPPEAGGFRVFVQVAGLAEALAALQARVRLLARVNADVLLAVRQRQEGLAADFAGVFARSFDHQDVVLRERLLALGEHVC